MSRLYAYNLKYHNHNRTLVVVLSVMLALFVIAVSAKFYYQYQKLNGTSSSRIDNSAAPVFGYINPYFMFKDTGQWVQDKAQSGPGQVVYSRYSNGTNTDQLSVYINKIPPSAQLSSTRVLPVQVIDGDSLIASSISASCASQQSATRQSDQEVSFYGVKMVCDPNPSDYSVILSEKGGNYVLHMLQSKVPETFVILYKSYGSHPGAQNIINIANSFKAI